MSQQQFSRPGAVDLSALRRPAGATAGGPAGGSSGGAASAPGSAAAGAASGSAYAVQINEAVFQQILERSMTAPVLLVFYSRTQAPESGTLADDVVSLAGEFDGRFLAGLVDVDAEPAIAQAMQIPSVPLAVLVVDGRPMPLFQEVLPIDELRAALTQLMQQLTTQGITGRHQPLASNPAEDDGAGEPAVDPRYAPAQDALAAGDINLAVAEYQKLVDGNPADAEAVAGLAMAGVLQRTQGVDLDEARSKAAASPEDFAAQTMVADLDLLGGHVDDAFNRLIELVRRTTGDEREAARKHLVGLFAAVGNDDARVLKARGNLANALF